MTRTYFIVCRALGSVLRSARYSKAMVAGPEVRKRRRFYAPLLIWLGGPLMRVLDTGVRVLPESEWHERERRVYQTVRGTSIRTDPHGMVVLPVLNGKTLSSLLEDPALAELERQRAIRLAVVALAEFHHLGFTHGDAMAENVLVDLDAGVSHWFDFETVHESTRPMAWKRADDVRALLVTCLVRTPVEKRADTISLVLNAYGDDAVTDVLARSFTSIWQRPLTFHLAQAGLSFECFGEIAGLLRDRQ